MPEEARAPALVRAWRWIWAPSLRSLHVDSCPRCGSTVVVPPAKPERAVDVSSLRAGAPARLLGTQAPPPDDGQLLAACPEHGWAPYNDRSLKLRRTTPDED